MAKKKPTFFGLALRTIVLLAEASCATSACLVLTSGELSEDGAEFLATIGAFWLGLSVFTWIFATVAGWIGMTNIVKKAGWGFFGTLLGGPLLFVWMLFTHIIEFFRYIFAYIFGAAVDTPAVPAPSNETVHRAQESASSQRRQKEEAEKEKQREYEEFRSIVWDKIESAMRSYRSKSLFRLALAGDSLRLNSDENGNFCISGTIWVKEASYVSGDIDNPDDVNHATNSAIKNLEDAVNSELSSIGSHYRSKFSMPRVFVSVDVKTS